MLVRAGTATAGGELAGRAPVPRPRPPCLLVGGTGRRARFRQLLDVGEGVGDAPVDVTGSARSVCRNTVTEEVRPSPATSR